MVFHSAIDLNDQSADGSICELEYEMPRNHEV
jgi:hypothetical protein